MAAALVFTLLFLCLGLGLASTVSYEPMCPVSCLCEAETRAITCRETLIWESTWHDIKVINEKFQVETLEYRGELPGIPGEVQALSHLQRLSLAHGHLHSISPKAFQGLASLEELDLSFSRLESVAKDAFAGLTSVHTLRLNGNHLSTLPEGLFEGLTGLKTLDLSGNDLVTLPRLVFSGLGNLEALDLGRNKLTFLSAEQVGVLTKLKSLDLSHNQVPSIHKSVSDALERMPSLASLDFSSNPWDCSCNLAPLLALIHSPIRTFRNLDGTLCSSPQKRAEIQVGRLEESQLECEEPAIDAVTNGTQVYYRTDVELSCPVSGLPRPAVVWEAPWGQLFAHPGSLSFLGDLAFNTTITHSYEDGKVLLISTITAKENGILQIVNFRSAFRGNFTCHAINSVGNDSAVVHLHIAAHIKDIYHLSLFLGFGSGGAFFVLGVIIGGIKVLVLYIQKKCCKQEVEEEEEEKKPESIVTLDEIEVFAPDEDDLDNFDYKDDPGTPPAAILISDGSTPNPSPQKCPSPAEEIPTGWIPSNIVETLEEVRGRLRYGVERKMEKMRSHVKSIKESGSSYVHNIRESGIQAADKVKAGVVLGVESLKFTAQSFKEFCGTGDMGGQTISMVSVSTDVDTSEKTEVVKTVTFV